MSDTTLGALYALGSGLTWAVQCSSFETPGRAPRPPVLYSGAMVQIRLSSDLDHKVRAGRSPIAVDEFLARFPEVPADLRDEAVLQEYVAAFGPLLPLIARKFFLCFFCKELVKQQKSRNSRLIHTKKSGGNTRIVQNRWDDWPG